MKGKRTHQSEVDIVALQRPFVFPSTKPTMPQADRRAPQTTGDSVGSRKATERKIWLRRRIREINAPDKGDNMKGCCQDIPRDSAFLSHGPLVSTKTSQGAFIRGAMDVQYKTPSRWTESCLRGRDTEGPGDSGHPIDRPPRQHNIVMLHLDLHRRPAK